MIKRYGSGYELVVTMPFDEAYEVIESAKEKEVDDRLFFRWVIDYQTEMPFDEFKEKICGKSQTQQNPSNKTIDDILFNLSKNF